METSGTKPKFLKGSISDFNGAFSIGQVPNGQYRLQVTSVGYKMETKALEVSIPQMIDAGTIFLRDSSLSLAGVVVAADRIPGKSETDRTIYHVNDEMLSASGSAPELLRQIPGVTVDLKQKISIDGRSDILLFVDGKERDRSYISQLSPSQIDRIEVLNAPPANYEGSVSRVMNIVLKQEKDSGLSGHLFSEIPVSADVVYMFPAYSLNFTRKKINLYTSYNGEINYEDIDEKTSRQILDNASPAEISSVQRVRQKNLSHKFHYGIDYHLTPRDIFNFYGSLNHYSYEQDGDIVVEPTGKPVWEAQKEETDDNRNLFHSLFYKHLFNDEGREITIDISNAHVRSDNEIIYRNASVSRINAQEPGLSTTVLRVDHTNPLNENVRLGVGLKFKARDMHDETTDGFTYKERVYALYGTFRYSISNFEATIGLRAEDAEAKLNGNLDVSAFSLLPYASLHLKVSGETDLYLSFRRSVNRPSVYQLNPYSYTEDPYTLRKGNPSLSPELRNQVHMEYTTRVRGNYMSAQLFYQTKTNVINSFTILNDSNLFITREQNLGNIHQYGFQFTGVLKFGKLSINPSLRLYNQSTFVNHHAEQCGIENKDNLVFETGISSVLSLRKEFALSAIFQYATAKENIQDNSWSDALYFISLDKTFRNNLKVGIVTALPFAKTFVYQGSDIASDRFTSEYTGNLKLPTVPFMFRVSYRFNVGKNRNVLERDKEVIDKRTKQGF